MPHKARVVESALLRKGFRRQNARHRRLFYHDLRGDQTAVFTILSHGSDRDIGDDLVARMARQCHLSRREFDDLIRCPMSRQAYEARLRQDGHI